MRRAAVLMLLLLAVPVGARADVYRCEGMAPAEPGCAVNVIATYEFVDGLFVSTTFVGLVHYRIDGPTGFIEANCYAYPGVATCVPSGGGWFAPGDLISLSVSTTGAGAWSFSLYY